MKKTALFAIFILSLFAFVACKRSDIIPQEESLNISAEIPDSGITIDITEKNNQAIFANPGDVVLVVLKGEKKALTQWSFREPTAGGFLSLKEHTVISEQDLRLKADEYLSEWKIKIIKPGVFTLRFNLEDPLKPKIPKQAFKVKIISGEKLEELSGILLDVPKENDIIAGKEVNIIGYAKNSAEYNGLVYYQLTDEKNAIIQEGDVQTLSGSAGFGYFEKKILLKKIQKTKGTLKVYQLSVKDKSELNPTTVNIQLQ